MFIIGKSSLENDNYDVLVLCIRNIKYAKILNFIEIIGQDSFQFCADLRKVEFESGSKLKIIEKDSFFGSSLIESFTFPSSLEVIEDGSFYYCLNLRYIDFEQNSKLKSIGKEAFSQSSIESFLMPPNVVQIDETAFFRCKYLQIIEIDENSKLECIDQMWFVRNKYAIVMVPEKLNDHIQVKRTKLFNSQ